MRLGLRLLTRTTRRVAPTQAGERLIRTVGPRLEEIETELAALTELRDKPAGTIRVTATSSLDADLGGTGAIVYSGDPPTVTKNIAGTGSITAG